MGCLFRFFSGVQSRNKREENKFTPHVFLSGEKQTPYFCAFTPCSFRKEDLEWKSVKSTDKIIKMLQVLHTMPRAMAFGNPAGRKGLLCGKILGGRNKWSEELWWGSCNSFCFTNMGEAILPLPSSFLFCTPKQMVSSAQQSP